MNSRHEEPAPVDLHDPTISAPALARRIDELARALNYATRPGDARLRYAPDAYLVLDALREALSKLPQACAQIAVFLDRQLAAGELIAEPGFAHASAPDVAVLTAAEALDRAAGLAARAGSALGEAQSAISGLSNREPEAQPMTRGDERDRLAPRCGVLPDAPSDAPVIDR